MRLAGRERLGFYPLPIPEAERMRKFLAFPDKQCCALDPCVGDGAAFAEIASDKNVQRCGVELDAGRAEQARTSGIEVIHGNCFDVQCPVESFSLTYLNPPYDLEIGEQKSQRMEKLFLEHVHRWLIRGGILVFVVPAKRIADCAALLSRDFRDARVYRLTETESARYKQVVLLGVRRTRQERDRLPDSEIIQAQLWLSSLERKLEELPPLPSEPDHLVRRAAERTRAFGSPRASLGPDRSPTPEIVGLSPSISRSFRATGRRDWPPTNASARGHVGLLCTAGMLNGIFGDGEMRHIAHWQSIKLVDRSEEEEDGKTIIREKERFSNELTLVFCTGEITSLK